MKTVRRMPRARARTKHTPGTMNKTEQAYNDRLRMLFLGGEIAGFWFEAIKLKLAPNTFYTPDFLVLCNDGTLECHEVKGHWEDDARVKIKVAATMFPFRFVAVKPVAKKDGGGWKYEEIPGD